MNSTSQLSHQESLNRNKIFFVNLISLLMGFTSALLTFIISSYFTQILGTENIGWTFLISNIILLFSLLILHNFVRVINKTNLFYLILICKISLFVALILFNSELISVVFLMAYIIIEALSWTVIQMILESYAVDNHSGKIYGFNLTIVNVGFIFGPLVSTQILDQNGFVGIFTLALILNAIIFLIAFFKLKKTSFRFKRQTNFKEILTKFWQRSDIQKIFYTSFALEFFFALMVIYTPLYLLEKGFEWTEIGIIFSLMLIPFLIVQYPAGFLADKKFGEKRLLFLSFLIMGISSLIFAFTQSVEIMEIALILFMTRIGAAFITALRLSYFYKRIDSDDVGLMSIFQTAKPIAYIIAPAIAGICLLFFPLNFVFILGAIIAFSALWPIYKLEK
jgi:MFS family permease